MATTIKADETKKVRKNLNPDVETAGEEIPDEEFASYEKPEESIEEEAIPVPKSVPLVTIHCIKDHKTNIGGVRYHLKRKMAYKVPNDVATVLSNSGIAVKK